jgi:hypothetical protein
VTAVCRMAGQARREYAMSYRGARVRITFARGWREPIIGRVITVALPACGTVADQLVVDVRGDDYYPVAYSLATVGTLERVTS